MSAAVHRRRKAQGTHDSVCSTPAGQHAHVYVCVTHRLSLAMRLLRDAQGTLYRKVNCDECNWQLWPVGAQYGSRAPHQAIVRTRQTQRFCVRVCARCHRRTDNGQDYSCEAEARLVEGTPVR